MGPWCRCTRFVDRLLVRPWAVDDCWVVPKQYTAFSSEVVCTAITLDGISTLEGLFQDMQLLVEFGVLGAV